MKAFGRFKGMPHEGCNENFDDYRNFKNTIPKEKVIEYLESDKVDKWYSSMPSYDIFTGKPIECGLLEDAEYIIPMEFLHYYKNYDIGIPYEYEEYLKGIIDY